MRGSGCLLLGPHSGSAQRDLGFPCALRWSPAGTLAGVRCLLQVGRQVHPAVCPCPSPPAQPTLKL